MNARTPFIAGLVTVPLAVSAIMAAAHPTTAAAESAPVVPIVTSQKHNEYVNSLAEARDTVANTKEQESFTRDETAAALKATVADDVAGVAAAQTSLDAAHASLAAARKRAVSTEKQAVKAGDKLTEARKALEAARQNSRMTKSDHDAAQSAYESARKAADEADAALDRANTKVADTDKANSIARDELAKAQKAEVHAQGVCQAAQSAVDQATAELDQARAALAAAEQGVDSPTDLQARVDAALRVWNKAERTLADARKNRLQAEEVVSAAEKKAEGATQAHDAAVSADSDLAARRAQARATLDAARHHLAETRKADADAQQRVAEASAVVQEASQERADAVGMVGATSSAVGKAEADKVAADERLAHWSNVMIDDLIAAGSFGEDLTIDALVKKFVQARATAEYAKAALEKVAATEAEDSAAYAAALARYRTAVADLDKAEKALATHLSANTGRERETLSATTSRGTDQSARTAFEFPPATAGTTTLTDVSHHKVAEQPGGRVDNPVHIGLPPTGVDSDPVSSLGYIAASLTLAMGITIPRRKR
ncbi:hypothetical protein [Cutibacterium granulosum]|uniref:hypothetical protein n=1 Tax=Cutibacterium granulosum TaxID=33011 RepID=UPI002573DD72|nr:hypothetical protein [Cutibacterium granulosum]MDU4677954.1 hypothetical protein [Cutibacterium granulosum]MDU7728521.1 hypothetical protein [Cutibacterium granulosum]BDQ40397.1 hypothetical protein TPCG7_10460 [Cutibacterium granulosum]